MIKINELKEGDVLTDGCQTITILHNLGKVVIVERPNYVTSIYSEKELNKHGYELVPPTPEKKYFMGFEVREYPERPIVEVTHTDGGFKFLRRLAEVKEDYVYCEKEHGAPTTRWDYIYRIPETKINE